MSIKPVFYGPRALHESATRLGMPVIQLPPPKTFLETPEGWIPVVLPERKEMTAREKLEAKKKSLKR